ncbi:hypothetical protein ALC62_15400 [Cyphomyrmex costatus]|uniref:Uncharacterized protein n=1 Tax=Cyphomyrmex costatus TaxID=456900 RepID=A0A151I794_9HYME|nr:hypothetical protein ALC62_15400 [Cyphomyrmex costatus]
MPSRGRGLLNKAINALPFELHIPGYQFCGPGTRLEKRLARGDRGINPLDTAHSGPNRANSHNNGLTERHAADNILAEKARKRITARDSSLTERAAATAVWAAMKAKTKLGMGLKTKKLKSKRILPIANAAVSCLFFRCWASSGRWSVERRESPRL